MLEMVQRLLELVLVQLELGLVQLVQLLEQEQLQGLGLVLLQRLEQVLIRRLAHLHIHCYVWHGIQMLEMVQRLLELVLVQLELGLVQLALVQLLEQEQLQGLGLVLLQRLGQVLIQRLVLRPRRLAHLHIRCFV
jgi:hypothetical protein